MMLTFFLKLFTGIYHKLFETDLSNFQNSYFQDISESVILSYNLILLFLLIQIFSQLSIWNLPILTGFCIFSETWKFNTTSMVEIKFVLRQKLGISKSLKWYKIKKVYVISQDNKKHTKLRYLLLMKT